MRILATLFAAVVASPAFAASGPFFSLKNTDFIVLLGFVLFVLILVKYKVPGTIGKMLDQRADGIKSELDEARALRDEAQSILASYERKQKEVQDQADRIIATARTDAQAVAEQAKKDLEVSLARRLAAAQEQIASAQSSAERDVRDSAVAVAISVARDIIAKQMTAADGNKLIDAAIADVEAKLH